MSGEPAKGLEALDEFAPRIHTLVIGVGGTGKEALVGLTRGMDELGMQYGETHPSSRRVVDGIFMDGDSKEVNGVSADENPDSAAMRAAGVRMVSLNLPNQDAILKRKGLTGRSGILTSDFPSESDPEGCKGDGRVGPVRWIFFVLWGIFKVYL